MKRNRRDVLFLALFSLMAAAATLLAIRLLAGPFHSALVSVNSPVNAASVVAVAFVLLILIRAQRAAAATQPAGRLWLDLTVLAGAVAVAFSPNLRSPFVYDDYGHILQMSYTTWSALAGLFKPVPDGHPLFFRPIGFAFYWLDFHWAGSHAVRWHVWNLVAHAANSCLMYLLLRRCGFTRVAACPAALLFAVHGSRAETVAWVDARFDLQAAFLALCALLSAMEYARTGRRLWFLPLTVCTALAVYTKESAFCLPFLPLALLPLVPRSEWRRAAAACLTLFWICAILFAYRWWAIGGIGGYNAVWPLRPLHTLEAVLFRQWAFLLFPVNWSTPVEWWLVAAAVAFIAMLLTYAIRSCASRAGLWAGLAFIFAAVIPVQQLLMFQPDFAGARVLYLPVAGLAILWAAILERTARSKLALAMAAVLIAFNLAALEHNLRPWRTTPETAAAVCRALGQELAKDARPVFVSGLPNRLDGAYFLSNGFAECVQMNSGQPAARVHLAAVAGRRFIWNQEQGRLEEKE